MGALLLVALGSPCVAAEKSQAEQQLLAYVSEVDGLLVKRAEKASILESLTDRVMNLSSEWNSNPSNRVADEMRDTCVQAIETAQFFADGANVLAQRVRKIQELIEGLPSKRKTEVLNRLPSWVRAVDDAFVATLRRNRDTMDSSLDDVREGCDEVRRSAARIRVRCDENPVLELCRRFGPSL